MSTTTVGTLSNLMLIILYINLGKVLNAGLVTYVKVKSKIYLCSAFQTKAKKKQKQKKMKWPLKPQTSNSTQLKEETKYTILSKM